MNSPSNRRMVSSKLLPTSQRTDVFGLDELYSAKRENQGIFEPVFFQMNLSFLDTLDRLNSYTNPNDCVTNALQAMGFLDERTADFFRVLTPFGVLTEKIPDVVDIIFENRFWFGLSNLAHYSLVFEQIWIPPGYMAFACLVREDGTSGHAFVLCNPYEHYDSEVSVHAMLRLLVIDPQVIETYPYSAYFSDYISMMLSKDTNIRILGINRKRNPQEPFTQPLITINENDYSVSKHYKPTREEILRSYKN